MSILRKHIFFASGVVLILVLYSCTGTKDKEQMSISENGEESDNSSLELTPSEYMNWIVDKENSMLKEQKLGELIYSIQFKPAQAMVCLEERKEQIPQSTVDKKLGDYSDMLYFDLKIEMENGQGELLKQDLSSAGQYDQRVNYCAFAMQKDIFLVSGKDTLPCVMYHFERAYDVAPYSKFLLGFGRVGLDKSDKQIVFNDRLFGNGLIKFSFSNAVITQPPKLKGI